MVLLVTCLLEGWSLGVHIFLYYRTSAGNKILDSFDRSA
jgi:hypothetical protein